MAATTEMSPSISILDHREPQPEAFNAGSTISSSRLDHVKSQILTTTQLFIQAINTRKFSSPPWSTSYTSAFIADTDFLSSEKQEVNLEEYTLAYKSLTDKFPEYHCEILEALVHIEQGGIVVVWLDLEVTGSPPGIKRSSSNLLKFRNEDGEWKCFRKLELRGSGWLVERGRGWALGEGADEW